MQLRYPPVIRRNSSDAAYFHGPPKSRSTHWIFLHLYAAGTALILTQKERGSGATLGLQMSAIQQLRWGTNSVNKTIQGSGDHALAGA
jgi:hypothetical protein